jgi:biopolymer transport protein ExbD
MSEIQISSSAKQKGVKSMINKSTRVDLTPMVDLGFLLITFFVFTSTMVKPVVMQINQPNDTNNTIDPICASCALTVLLDKNNRIKYYEGDASTAVLKETGYGASGIRKIFSDKKMAVKKIRGNADEMVLIIKPMKESQFMNFVDIADEVTINCIKRYYLDEMKPEDFILLKKNNF